MKESLFYAKILLFGEYGIIEDSMGLSIPYNYYKGKFSFESDADEKSIALSNANIKAFAAHLRAEQEKGMLKAKIDLDKLDKDIARGMHFNSNIPQGFGVGSSGALVAAIYNHYAIDKLEPTDNSARKEILSLKEIFAQMESYFHGKSSGMDPLICYLNIPILMKTKSDLDQVGLPSFNAEGKGAIFLLNTGNPGETQPLVNWFLEKLKHDGFRTMVKEQFVKYNDECIKSFLKGDYKPLFASLKKLSKLALDNFTPMIPDLFHKLWEQGIETNAYYLKLCGSGGGGFILGFTPDLNKAKKYLKGYELEIIHRF
ncbi:MAG TPA: mevalonate kinase [Bacteroidetes bacterium]|nr:mevalonate kinase [Bacteroidota bacterium]